MLRVAAVQGLGIIVGDPVEDPGRQVVLAVSLHGSIPHLALDPDPRIEWKNLPILKPSMFTHLGDIVTCVNHSGHLCCGVPTWLSSCLKRCGLGAWTSDVVFDAVYCT